jgi:hypothetical protein
MQPNRGDLDFALREARQKAVAFLDRFAPGGELPVDPFALAERRKITVKRASGLGEQVVGHLDYLGDGRVEITLSSDYGNDGMIRFTLAHELGHHEIDGHFDVLFADSVRRHQCRGPFSSDVLQEKQADAFASELLMPTGPCRKFLAKLPADDDGLASILALSEHCQVSIHAAANRYIDLVERPTALIVSTNGTVDYCARSEELRKRLGKGSSITRGSTLPVHSKAARMTADEVRAAHRTKAGETRWSNWFGGSDRSNVQEEALGLGAYGKIITVLSDNDWDLDGEDEDGDRED